MTLHTNSIISNRETRTTKQKRNLEIFDVYQASPTPLTDREVMTRLGYTDLNMVRPRITEMITDDNPRLMEVGIKIDFATRRSVRTVTVFSKAFQQTFL